MQHRIQLSNLLLMAVKGMSKKQPVSKMTLAKGIPVNYAPGNIKYKPRNSSFIILGVDIRQKEEELVF